MTSHPFNPTQPASAEAFVGREALVAEIVDRVSETSRHSFTLIGGRRCGKTSVLEAVRREMLRRASDPGGSTRRVVPVQVSTQSLSAPDDKEAVLGELLHAVERTLCGTPSRPPRISLGLRPSTGAACPTKFALFRDRLADLLYGADVEVRVVLLVDELDVLLGRSWTHDLFGNLRSLIYDAADDDLRENIRLVVTGSGRLLRSEERGSPLANATTLKLLTGLDDNAMRHLVNLATTLPLDTREAVLAWVGGAPFVAHYLLRHLVDADSHTPASVHAIARRFLQESECILTLDHWWASLGRGGRAAWIALTRAETEMTSAAIRGAIPPEERAQLDQGLRALKFHALVDHDFVSDSWRARSEFFREWADGRELPLPTHDARWRGECRAVLLDAFPTEEQWAPLVRYAAELPVDVVALGGSLDVIAYRIIDRAIAEDWIDRLLQVAHETNPGNPRLREFLRTR